MSKSLLSRLARLEAKAVTTDDAGMLAWGEGLTGSELETVADGFTGGQGDARRLSEAALLRAIRPAIEELREQRGDVQVTVN